MGWQPWDLLNDLALARGLRGADADSDSRYLRGRVAAVLWIPGLALALMVGGRTGRWEVAIAVLVVTLVVMAMVARPPTTTAIAKRERGDGSRCACAATE